MSEKTREERYAEAIWPDPMGYTTGAMRAMRSEQAQRAMAVADSELAEASRTIPHLQSENVDTLRRYNAAIAEGEQLARNLHVALAERDMARVEIERLRAGADDTPREQYAQPTPGQFIHMLNEMSGQERLDLAARLIRDSEIAHEAFMCDWKHRAETAEAELLRLRVADSKAFPVASGEPTSSALCATCPKCSEAVPIGIAPLRLEVDQSGQRVAFADLQTDDLWAHAWTHDLEGDA